MSVYFYVAAVVAVLATALMITRVNVVHALLDLVVSLLAVAVAFASLGAPFVAALEVIVYAGAIVVLFLFAVMMLNLGGPGDEAERRWLPPAAWAGPLALALVLVVEVLVLLARGRSAQVPAGIVEPRQVALSLYGPYLIGLELVSVLLTGALVGAHHLSRRERSVSASDRSPAPERTKESGGPP